MSTSRWWIAVYYAATVVVAAVIVLSEASWPGGTWLALAVLAALAVLFPVLGWPALREGRPGYWFAALLVAGLGLGSVGNAQMLNFQVIAMPLLWMLVVATGTAVAVNAATAVGGWLGSSAGVGFAPASTLQLAVVQLIVLAFSICMGLWISHVIGVGVQRGQLLDQLRATQGELETLHRDAGAAAERERIARELHDTIAQSLTSIVMLAERSRSRSGSARGDRATGPQAPSGTDAPPGPPGTPGSDGSDGRDASLELIEQTAREALAEARSLVAATARVPSDGSPLAETLARLAERFRRENEIDVRVAVEPVPIARGLEVVLLRCVQEGLANVRKHAHAATASVVLAAVGDEVVLTVCDDGVGLAGYAPEEERGFGLGGMRDRVGLTGGTVELTRGASGRGALLRVRLPISEEGTP